MYLKNIVCFSALLCLIKVVYGQGELCTYPNNEPGVCQILPNCPSLLRIYQDNPRSREVINWLVQCQRSCGTRSVNRNPIVCCQDNVVLVPDDEDVNIAPHQTTPPTPPPTPPPTQPPPPPPPTSNCADPNGVKGNCIGLKQCPIVLNEFLKRQQDQAYVRYIQASNANCNRVQQNICCPLGDTPVGPQPLQPVTVPPPPPPTQARTPVPVVQPSGPITLLTPDTGCGFSNTTHTRIVGGGPAELGAWPWMALLGYTDNLGEVGFKCGGSLITRRHILTAAHCIKSTLSTVRLGEYNLDTDSETKHIDVPVIKVEKHPMYDKRDGHSDLAILTLGQDVQFTHFIVPICIPYLDPLKSKSYEGFLPFVAGWGRTTEGGSTAPILQQLQITVFKNGVCKDKYNAIKKLISEKQFDKAVLCAGVLAGGKDSCQGDSGGPLMSPNQISGKPYYYQIGVVSYGIGCARADVPGVYARVQSFTDWIKQKVEEPLP